jgi:hypothetical protein
MHDKLPENVSVTPTSVDFHAVQAQFSFLQGKVLTIIEASIPSGTQLEAVKGLIKGAFRDQTDYIARLCFPELPMYSQSELESQGIDVEKVAQEAELLQETE